MTPGFVFSEKPIQIERGSGTALYDVDGTEFLDAGASYGCVPAGHCHPEVVTAVRSQSENLFYVQGSYPTAPRNRLYERLADLAPGDMGHIWLCNSGTEANEAALKFARHATGRSKVIATKRGFHGRTLGALSATWKQAYRNGFEPLVEGFEFVEYGDAAALAQMVDGETAAVIVEPVQGEGGVVPAPEGYLEAVRELTEEVGAAMIVDEIQTGLGRTGSFWAVDRAGVVPDVLTTAKGLANGLPMGATLCREWIAEDPGDHGSTFSGGPVVSAAADATLRVIETNGLPAQAEEVGGYLRSRLRATIGEDVRELRGQGLLVGIEVKRGSNHLLRELAMEHNVLALPAGRTVLRLLPSLVFDKEDVDALVSALAAVLSEEGGS